MKRLLLIALMLSGCASAPVYPPPQADKSQIVVKVSATPKAGVQGARTEGQYDKESVEKGRRFTRVSYSKMDCIAVVLTGGPPTPRDMVATTDIDISSSGFAKDLFIACVLFADNASSWPTITFHNSRGSAVTLFGSAQGSDAALFEAIVPAGGKASCTLTKSGLYDVYCDEDENAFCQIVATDSPFASLCESGGEAFFEGLAPGTYEIEVFAPRLPVWKARINTTAGKRETLYAEVTVNGLPKAK